MIITHDKVLDIHVYGAVMMPHSDDDRCVCDDGRAAGRDISEPCVRVSRADSTEED